MYRALAKSGTGVQLVRTCVSKIRTCVPTETHLQPVFALHLEVVGT